MTVWLIWRAAARGYLRAPALTLALLTTTAIGIGSMAVVNAFIRGLTAPDATVEATGVLTRVAWLLRAAASGVFLIACANVAALLLARASARSRDTAIRAALGANRLHLSALFFAEGAVLSIAGGALGGLLAFWTAAIMPALFFAPDAEQLVFAPDGRGAIVTAAVGAAITIGCALIPLAETRSDRPAMVLQRESLGTSRPMRRVRSTLVIVQMACCCALVISTGLLLEGFQTALETTLGRRLGNPILVTVEAPPRTSHSEQAAHGLQYFREVERVANDIGGITTSGWVVRPPGSRPAGQFFEIEQPDVPLHDVVAERALFSPRSLATVMLPPVEGRMFGGGDTPDSCPVVIVNEEAAQELFAGYAVGQSIEDSSGQLAIVIGVVAMRPEAEQSSRQPTIYYYAQQTGPPGETIGRASFRVTRRAAREPAMLDANAVSETYFERLGLAPLAGTIFSSAPSAARECRVAVIDQAAADRYFGGHAIGGAVIDEVGRRTTIVGVVQTSLLRHWQRPPTPAIYFPVWQDFMPRMTLFLDVRRADSRMLDVVTQRLGAVPGGAGDVRVTTLDAHLRRTALAPERLSAVLVGAAAVIAFVLGTLGAHGVLAESTRQRRRDIALRMALGAQRWRVAGELLVEALRLAALGIVPGLIAAFIAARWLTPSQAAGAAGDIWIWLSGPLALLAVVAMASVLPARRALSVDPLAALREQ